MTYSVDQDLFFFPVLRVFGCCLSPAHGSDLLPGFLCSPIGRLRFFYQPSVPGHLMVVPPAKGSQDYRYLEVLTIRDFISELSVCLMPVTI